MFVQMKDVDWLNTPKGTFWVSTSGTYIQPEDENQRNTPLGVNLQLLSDNELFGEIITIEI